MIDTRYVEQLISTIQSADGEPLVIRDMILEGDAIDTIAYILNKAPTATTWKDVDVILVELEEMEEFDLYDVLFAAVYGVDSPSTPNGAK